MKSKHGVKTSCIGKAGNLPTDETSQGIEREVIYYDNDKRRSNSYFCPKCGATVKGEEDTNVICGDCMEKMLVKTGRDR